MRTETHTAFGKFLRETRERLDCTLSDVAMKSGVSAAQISRIETGKRGVPHPETIKKLSQGYGVDYELLMKLAGYLN